MEAVSCANTWCVISLALSSWAGSEFWNEQKSRWQRSTGKSSTSKYVFRNRRKPSSSMHCREEIILFYCAFVKSLALMVDSRPCPHLSMAVPGQTAVCIELPQDVFHPQAAVWRSRGTRSLMHMDV
ncbi:hypothetical protein EYF80_032566 [Liparis tanakae]|uniref:REJ domain-containing protein n=1 Tax=Liparis tanakae TaxID=230148 RepID=A0A4Z2GWY6_9TELE|nr:hypothetical protein EYF80_032566 [Liparis tanakae]